VSSNYKVPRTLFLLALLIGVDAHAGVTAERTRVIIHEGQREASLQLVNQNTYPVILQTWVDDGSVESTPMTARAPIMPLPPVFRLNPDQQRNLRLMQTDQPLAKDRESLYWLNLYEIPPQPGEPLADGQSRLTVTLRTQMKVIYRPHRLAKGAEDAPLQLKFHRLNNTVEVENPTPYYITLAGANLYQGSNNSMRGELLAPFSKSTLSLTQPLLPRDGDIRFFWIDDSGNFQKGQASLAP
jgi:P pilus assembly chaperone PapD